LPLAGIIALLIGSLLSGKHTQLRTLSTRGAAMSETRKAKWSFRLAVLGSVLGVAGFLLSVANAIVSNYQWLSSQRESRIIATIEISKSYIRDTGTSEMIPMMAAYMDHPLSEQQVLVFGKQLEVLEYIATLANNDRLDERYLAGFIQCGILVARGGQQNLKKKIPKMPLSDEIWKFSERAKCDSLKEVNALTVDDFDDFSKQFGPKTLLPRPNRERDRPVYKPTP
jgi:hypothetical protein